MGAGADVYKPVTDILHQWLSIPEYLHKIIKSMHMQVIEINAFCKDFSHQLSFGTVKEYVLIMNLLCVVTYVKC